MKANDFNFFWFPELWETPRPPPGRRRSVGGQWLGAVVWLIALAYLAALGVMVLFGLLGNGPSVGPLLLAALLGTAWWRTGRRRPR